MAAAGRLLASRCVKFNVGYRNLSCVPHDGLLHLTSLQRVSLLLCRCSSKLSSTPAGEIDVKYSHGFVSLSVPLPSRRERCVFSFLPATQTISDLVSQLQREDKGTDHVAVYSVDGDRLARSTPIDVLLRQDFIIVINDLQFTATVPAGAELKSIDELRSFISQLYSQLNVEEYQLQREHDLQCQLADLQRQIEPFEQLKQEIAAKAEKRTSRLTWLGLGLMGLQFGLLARLTWWEYSWDIMEPVTYFVGYGSAVAMFGYYILTKQEYVVPDVHDRELLLTLHRQANKRRLDVSQYNELRDKMRLTEYDLQRLRDPLQLHLPAEYLGTAPTHTQ